MRREPPRSTALDAAVAPGLFDGAEAVAPDWRPLLVGASARDVLARLVEGDPLGVRGRVAEHVAGEALLLDADRVQLRALAHCAHDAAGYRGRPELGAWVAERVARSAREIAAEEREAARGAPAPESAVFGVLAGALDLEPEGLRRACAAFNDLAPDARRAFFAVALEGRSLDEAARSAGVPAPVLARSARSALLVLLEHAVGTERLAGGGR